METENTSRQYGFYMGLFVVISCMVGAGIFTTSGYTLHYTGNPWGLMGIWILGGFMALCGALVISELATRMPHVGGDYVFVKEAFGPGAGFVVGWSTFVIGFAGPIALIAKISAEYIINAAVGYKLFNMHLLNVNGIYITIQLFATSLILITAIYHCLGYKASSRFQTILTVIKLAIFALLIGMGFTLGKGDWNHFHQGGWPKTNEWSSLATGLIYVSYGYSGWNAAAYIGGEMKSPEKTLARSMIGGTILVTILYLLMNVLYVYAVSPKDLTRMNENDVKLIGTISMVRLFGENYGNLIGAILGISMISSVSSYILTGPRISQVMARDGMFIPYLGDSDNKYILPIRGTVSLSILTIIMIWSGSFLDLLDFMSAGLALISGLVVASLIPLRNKATNLKIYRVPFYPLPVILFLGLILWALVNAIMDQKHRIPTLLSILTVAIGIPMGRFVRTDSHKQSV